MERYKIKILNEEQGFNKWLISEVIHIKKQKNGLNLQNDTEMLDPLYNDLIKKKKWCFFVLWIDTNFMNYKICI